MLSSIQGVYRDGKVELAEHPRNVRDEARVIVTFLEPIGVGVASMKRTLRNCVRVWRRSLKIGTVLQ